MTWFKVDDKFSQHPKVLSIPRRDRAAAIGLWTLAGTWCASHLTDGKLTRGLLGEFACTTRQAQVLVESGLWDATDDGYEFHDWGTWQPTKAQVEAERAAAKERMKRVRGSKGQPPRSPEQTTNTPRTSGEVRSTPTRPDPTCSSSNEEEQNSSSPDGEGAFDRFYAAYPRKVGRKDAAKAFAKAAREVSIDVLITAAERYAADPNQPQDRSKIPHPATWLNQGRWDDEPLPVRLDRKRTMPSPAASRVEIDGVEQTLWPANFAKGKTYGELKAAGYPMDDF